MLGFSLHVSLEEQVSITDDLDHENVVHGLRATILDDSVAAEEPLDPKRVAGRISCYVVKLGLAADAGLNALEGCDRESQDLLEYAEAVLSPKSGQLKESIVDEFEALSSDLLIIHLAEILPAYRGRSLSLHAVSRIIDLFGDGLVLCRPQPLQHVGAFESRAENARMGYDQFKASKADAMKRLRQHWERLGFRRIGRSDFYALSTSLRRPALEPMR